MRSGIAKATPGRTAANLMHVWALVGTVLVLAGCSTTRVDFALPEDYLLEDCVRTNVQPIETNAQLASAYLKRDNDLAVCNADKRALRVWRDSLRANKE